MQLKVSKTTKPGKLAGAIIHTLDENGGKDVALQAIGAGAVNQAVKAVAIARRMVDGKKEIYAVPDFNNTVVNGREITAINIKLTCNS